MNTRTTIILLLTALGLFLFVKFFEAPTTREAAELKQYVAKIDRDTIDAIEITSSERRIQLAKDNDQWRLQEPVTDRADSMAVNQLLGSVENLQRESSIKIEKKEQLKEFGLTKAAVRLKLRGKNAPPEFVFGADTAVEGKTYLRVENKNEIYVVSNDLKEQLTKPPDEFRDRSLTDLSVQQIERVVISKPSGQIELHREAEHWQLDKPLKARANDSRVSDLLAQTLNARIEKFIVDSTDLAKFGLAEPVAQVSFFTHAAEKPVDLQIGAAADQQNVYARLSSRGAIVVIPNEAAQLLNVNPNELRDKHLVRLNLDMVDRITISGGGTKILLVREGEEWTLDGDRPANEAMIRQTVNQLQNEQITRFAADSASDLDKFGLAQPGVTVRFSSYASENTAESEAGEQPIATLAFGKIEGEEIYARLEEEPYIVALNKNLLHLIPLDPVQWRALRIFNFEKDAITSLNRTGQAPVSLQKKNDGSWTAADGAIQDTNLQSLLNTLSSLRAARWIGATTNDHGFVKPTLTLSFQLTNKQQHTLTIGNTSPDGMRYATTGDGTFALSQPDYSALELPLLAQQKPQTTEVTSEPVALPTPEGADAVNQ